MLGRAMQDAWAITDTTAPSAGDCALTLLSAALAFVFVSCWLFTVRELRVKTPETT